MPYVKVVKVGGNKTGNTPEQRKEYNKRYYLERKAKLAAERAAEAEEAKELERINMSPQDYMKMLSISIELFEDPDDIRALELLRKDISMANMIYARDTGDFSKLKGIIFEEF